MRTRHFTPRVPVLYYESASARAERLAYDRSQRRLTMCLCVLLGALLTVLYFTIKTS